MTDAQKPWSGWNQNQTGLLRFGILYVSPCAVPKTRILQCENWEPKIWDMTPNAVILSKLKLFAIVWTAQILVHVDSMDAFVSKTMRANYCSYHDFTLFCSSTSGWTSIIKWRNSEFVWKGKKGFLRLTAPTGWLTVNYNRTWAKKGRHDEPKCIRLNGFHLSIPVEFQKLGFLPLVHPSNLTDMIN